MDSRILTLRAMRATRLMNAGFIARRGRITILRAHGVMEPRPEQSWRPSRTYLAPAHLERYVHTLQPICTFVSMSHAAEMLAGSRPVVPNAVVLTFDDGYRNNATEAWPILQRCGVPATFFVVTSRVERPTPFWFDRVDYAFQHLPRGVKAITVQLADDRVELATNDSGERFESCRALRQMGKRCGHDALESLAHQLEDLAGASLMDVHGVDDWTALMAADDVRRLSDEGADIGSHTVDHLLLDKTQDAQATDQLVRSKEAIEQWTDRTCAHFCYPSGRFNSQTSILARRAGYQTAVTTIEGTNRVGANPFELRRINLPPDLSEAELLGRLSGVSGLLRRLRSCLKL